MIPGRYKLAIVCAMVAAVALWAYFEGRESKQGELDALRQSYEVAYAQAAGARQARERIWEQAIAVAGEKYDERAKIADQSFDASLDRLRDAYASSARLRLTPKATGSCAEPSGPAAADVLRAGEQLAAILRDADRDRAALMACVGAWPG